MGWEMKVPAQTKLWSSLERYQGTFRALLMCPRARYRTLKCSHRTPYELTQPSAIRSWDRLLHLPRDHERDIEVKNNKIIRNILNLHDQGRISKAPDIPRGWFGARLRDVCFALMWHLRLKALHQNENSSCSVCKWFHAVYTVQSRVCLYSTFPLRGTMCWLEWR